MSVVLSQRTFDRCTEEKTSNFIETVLFHLRHVVSKISPRLFIVTIFVWSYFCGRFEKNDSVIGTASLPCKIRVGISTTKKRQVINCQSQGYYFESKAQHITMSLRARTFIHHVIPTKLFHGQLLRGRLDASLLQA